MRRVPRRRRTRPERTQPHESLHRRAAATNASLQIIRNGVPGSVMPASRDTDDEIRAIVGYLKSARHPPPSSAGLSARPTPNADLVTLTTNDGRVIHGERRNEDAFSIQIAEGGGRLQGYFKSSLKNIVRGERAPAANTDPVPGVAYRDILDGLKDPSRWLDVLGRLQRPASQPAHADHAGERRGSQASGRSRPARRRAAGGSRRRRCVWDGVLYVTGSNNYAWALDARTGRPFWRYRRELPTDLTYGARRRSIAASACSAIGCSWSRSTRTSLALDRATGTRALGHRCWPTTRSATPRRCAPLVVEGQGDRRHLRRRVSDPRVPRRLRSGDRQAHLALLTVPGPGEPGSETWPAAAEVLARGGGGDVDDRQLRSRARTLLYWGTGNPNPDYYGDDRKGDNLYTDSLVAHRRRRPAR